jgi:predicted ATPase
MAICVAKLSDPSTESFKVHALLDHSAALPYVATESIHQDKLAEMNWWTGQWQFSRSICRRRYSHFIQSIQSAVIPLLDELLESTVNRRTKVLDALVEIHSSHSALANAFRCEFELL